MNFFCGQMVWKILIKIWWNIFWTPFGSHFSQLFLGLDYEWHNNYLLGMISRI